MTHRIFVLFAVLLCASLAWAQETRGSLVGTVTDTSGAAVAGVKIRAMHVETGVASPALTNGEGVYVLRYLLTGTYNVRAEAAGFKTVVRENIEVRINDRIELPFVLEVGAVQETVVVSATTPLLETASASMGQVVDQRRVAELPLLHGNPMAVLELTPGLAQARTSNLGVWGGRAFDNSWTTSFTIDGAPPNSSEITMDGVPNTTTLGGSKSGGFQTVAYTPPADMVGEMKVQTASFDASVGYTSGAIINISVKAGSSEPHGSAYLYKMFPGTNANTWFGNLNGSPKTDFRYARWGGSNTGPVVLPKIYNGRHKTFYSYGYEGHHDRVPWAKNGTVPTAAQRSGDFSALLGVNTNYLIYDPASARLLSNGRVQRDAFPNNIIPQARFSSFTTNLLKYYPSPTSAGTADGGNNLPGPNLPDPNLYYSHLVRLDHTLTAANHLFGRFAVSKNVEKEFQDMFHNETTGANLTRRNRGASLDDVHTFSPSFIMNLRYGYTRFLEDRTPKGLGFNPTNVGYDAALIGTVDPRAYTFPAFAVDGYSTLGSENPSYNTTDVHSAAVSFDKLAGAHTLKSGYDQRWYRAYSQAFGQAVPELDFGAAYTKGPYDNSTASSRGQGLASFLLGIPTGGSIARNDSSAVQSIARAMYLQDDWKATKRLMVSVGLRYEYETAPTERFNRTSRDYDFSVASPIEAQVRENYAKAVVPEVPLSAFHVTGGVRFAGVGGVPRELYGAPKKAFAPRIGVTYSLTPKTVFRGGFGIFYIALGSRNIGVTQYGFSQTSQVIPSLDSGLTFRVKNLGSPFVDGITNPTGNTLGLSAQLGQGVATRNTSPKAPYMERWQLSVQRELPGRVLLDVGYLGNRSTGMLLSHSLSYVGNEWLSTSPARDEAKNTFMTQPFSNPFANVLPGTSLASSTLARSSFLVQYPQYTSFSGAVSQGYTWYHSLQAKVERRFATGYTFQVSYTFSKLMEATSYLNSGDAVPVEVLSSNDFPHRIAVSAIYELPFGQGRRWIHGNRVTDRIVGGWQVQGIYTAQSGQALSFGDVIHNGSISDAAIPNGERTIKRWFDTSGFETNSKKQLVYHLRTLSTSFSALRGDGINEFSLSAIKNLKLKERLKMQFRLEAINALNHVMFANPSTSVTATTFGTVTSEKSSGRSVQFGLKLMF